jgi:hypothetical protein
MSPQTDACHHQRSKGSATECRCPLRECDLQHHRTQDSWDRLTYLYHITFHESARQGLVSRAIWSRSPSRSLRVWSVRHNDCGIVSVLAPLPRRGHPLMNTGSRRAACHPPIAVNAMQVRGLFRGAVAARSAKRRRDRRGAARLWPSGRHLVPWLPHCLPCVCTVLQAGHCGRGGAAAAV